MKTRLGGTGQKWISQPPQITAYYIPLDPPWQCESNGAQYALIGWEPAELCCNMKSRLVGNRGPADRSTTLDHDALYTIGSALAARFKQCPVHLDRIGTGRAVLQYENKAWGNRPEVDQSTTSDHDVLYTIGSALAVRV